MNSELYIVAYKQKLQFLLQVELQQSKDLHIAVELGFENKKRIENNDSNVEVAVVEDESIPDNSSEQEKHLDVENKLKRIVDDHSERKELEIEMELGLVEQELHRAIEHAAVELGSEKKNIDLPSKVDSGETELVVELRRVKRSKVDEKDIVGVERKVVVDDDEDEKVEIEKDLERIELEVVEEKQTDWVVVDTVAAVDELVASVAEMEEWQEIRFQFSLRIHQPSDRE